MKLFLASSADKTLLFLRTLMPNVGENVLFVANAADPYKKDRFWIEWDREAFKKLGFNVHEADLREITPKHLELLLQAEDILQSSFRLTKIS